MVDFKTFPIRGGRLSPHRARGFRIPRSFAEEALKHYEGDESLGRLVDLGLDWIDFCLLYCGIRPRGAELNLALECTQVVAGELASERNSLEDERDRYRDRLQIDPGGTDKIDELEQSIQFKDHEIECLKRELNHVRNETTRGRVGLLVEEVEHLKLRCKTLSDELRSLVAGDLGDPGIRDPEHPCPEYQPGDPKPGADCETDGHFLCSECSNRAEESVELPDGTIVETNVPGLAESIRKAHVCGRCGDLVSDGQVCECEGPGYGEETDDNADDV